MEFRVLGPVGIRHAGQGIPLVAEKPKTVLTALLLGGDRVVSDAHLREVTWGPTPPATVDQQLYTYVSRLRKLLAPGATILRHQPGYRLVLAEATLDYAEFDRLAGLGYDALKARRHMAATEHLGAALALWRGPALGGVTEYLARVELPRLEEARMAALEGRIAADLALGRHDALVPELVGLVEAHPMRERLRAQLMTALYRTGRQADALAEYQRGREILAEELGIDPSSALNDVFQSILSGDPGLTTPAPAPPREVHEPARRHLRPAMLPPGVADFTGREARLRELSELLRADQAAAAPVVVTGPAGAGKSALTVQAGRACLAAFPDGQLYADLGGSQGRPRDPYDVLEWFLQALCEPGVPVPATVDARTQLYRSLLAERRVLVVLDNAHYEQQVRPLLPAGAGSRVVVTTRSRFTALEGARSLELEVFERSEALALLRRGAGAARLAAEPDVAEALLDRCGRLPIAVRVLAGRLAAKPHWTLAELGRRLTEGQRPLDELRLADIDVRAALRPSYRSLPVRARSALCRLSLLQTAEIPAWLAAVVLETDESRAEDIVETLVDVRLLEVPVADHSGRLRYRMPPVVRMFALEHAQAESSSAERRATVDRALTAWLMRARAAARSLADGRQVAAGSARFWYETEKNGLAAAFRQADADGHDTIARSLARTLTELRSLHPTDSSRPPRPRNPHSPALTSV